MSSTQHRVVFCTATNRIIDFVRTDIGEPDAAAIERLSPNYGTALTTMDAAEAQPRYEQQFITPVREITEQDYMEALIVLPPVAWTRARGGESFKLSERTAGSITAVYVALGGRFFRFDDDIRTPHLECLKRTADFISAKNKGDRHDRNPV